MVRWLLAASVVIIPVQANAQTASRTFVSGNELLAMCQGGLADQSICLGYVEGVSDSIGSLGVEGGLEKPSLPAGVTTGQVKDIVVAYLLAHPEMRHYQAAQLAFIAITAAFSRK